MGQSYKKSGWHWLLSWQLSLLAVNAITSQEAIFNVAGIAKPANQCPAGRLAAEGPLSQPDEQCPRHGPCYRGGEAEFCVFTTIARDNRGNSTVLPVLTERTRGPKLLQLLSDAKSDEYNRSAPPRYTVSPVPGKGLGIISTGELERGDHILSDSPTLMVDHCVMSTVPQYRLAWLMNEAASRLSDVQRDRIMSLAVFGEEAPDEHYLVGRIYATSAYMVHSHLGILEDGCGIGALFPEGMYLVLDIWKTNPKSGYTLSET